MNPQQPPAISMLTSANQPFAGLPDGATEAKRRRISPSKPQVSASSFQILFSFIQKVAFEFLVLSFVMKFGINVACFCKSDWIGFGGKWSECSTAADDASSTAESGAHIQYSYYSLVFTRLGVVETSMRCLEAEFSQSRVLCIRLLT